MVHPTNLHMDMNMAMMMTYFGQGSTTIVGRRTLGIDIIAVKHKHNKGHTQHAILVLLTQTEPGDNTRGDAVRLPARRDMPNG
jgi:hypothetical protein